MERHVPVSLSPNQRAKVFQRQIDGQRIKLGRELDRVLQGTVVPKPDEASLTALARAAAATSEDLFDEIKRRVFARVMGAAEEPWSSRLINKTWLAVLRQKELRIHHAISLKTAVLSHLMEAFSIDNANPAMTAEELAEKINTRVSRFPNIPTFGLKSNAEALGEPPYVYLQAQILLSDPANQHIFFRLAKSLRIQNVPKGGYQEASWDVQHAVAEAYTAYFEAGKTSRHNRV